MYLVLTVDESANGKQWIVQVGEDERGENPLWNTRNSSRTATVHSICHPPSFRPNRQMAEFQATKLSAIRKRNWKQNDQSNLLFKTIMLANQPIAHKGSWRISNRKRLLFSEKHRKTLKTTKNTNRSWLLPTNILKKLTNSVLSLMNTSKVVIFQWLSVIVGRF